MKYFYGYKGHVSMNAESNLITSLEVTSGEVYQTIQPTEKGRLLVQGFIDAHSQRIDELKGSAYSYCTHKFKQFMALLEPGHWIRYPFNVADKTFPVYNH